jgi:membrane fusion protein (multidrug efflux system)
VPPGTVVVATSTAPGAEAITITVVAIDATVNNETRNVRVRSIVNNPGERLRPGMFVQIRVPVDEARKFVAVPSSAVRRASYSDQVFVIVQTEGVTDGTSSLVAKQRYVKLGASVGENVIVLDGLKAGERVASSGSFKLRDGAHVTPSAGDARK